MAVLVTNKVGKISFRYIKEYTSISKRFSEGSLIVRGERSERTFGEPK